MTELRQAIADALESDLVLISMGVAVYYGAAPQGAQYPLITFQYLGGPADYTFGGDGAPAFEHGGWQLKASALDVNDESGQETGEAIRAQAISALTDLEITDPTESAVLYFRKTRNTPDFQTLRERGGTVYHVGCELAAVTKPL